ncbi:hypothetical protein NIES4071_102550 (plasmid) [Calothrix sp. NIES-4071]|nr:hypothetical protein NIES4071_102550 [Calothrix sp. NIES-4071]BAZ64636.1 hypothetical protein NIES4105_103690 [Calothrix sp. NIES-4105]
MESEKLKQVSLTIIWRSEIQGNYRGMMIVIPPENWSIFTELSQQQLASVLIDLATRVRLSSFLKQPRAPKKKKDPPRKRPTSSTRRHCKAFSRCQKVTKTRASSYELPVCPFLCLSLNWCCPANYCSQSRRLLPHWLCRNGTKLKLKP